MSQRPGVVEVLRATDGAERFKWIKRNARYYNDLCRLFAFHVEPGRAVLEIGVGTGVALDACAPSQGMGLDLSPSVAAESKKSFPKHSFDTWDGESPLPDSVARAFPSGVDYVLLVNTMGYWQDIQKSLELLAPLCHPGTRVIATYYNFLWAPVLALAEWTGLKMPQPELNWLSANDVRNLFDLTGYRVLRHGYRYLLPLGLGPISAVINRFVGRLPLFSRLGLTHFVIARMPARHDPKQLVASVVIPARNEKGNIEPAVRRLAAVAKSRPERYELIFVEGNSTDETADEIRRVLADPKIEKPFAVSFHQQTGTGKGDAVRLGFAKATGDLLLILDADLTVPPEDLPKFVDVYCTGRGEFLNGCRLVYEMERAAMMPLNLIANKFFGLAFTWLLGQSFKDTLCGTKVLSRANYERIARGRAYFGDFDPFGDFDLLFGASKLDLEIAEVPIRYRERVYGQTNISRWKHGWLLLKMCVFATTRIKFVK